MYQLIEVVLLISGIVLLASWVWVLGCYVRRARALARMDAFEWRRAVDRLKDSSTQSL